jgi:hypothetical protein
MFDLVEEECIDLRHFIFGDSLNGDCGKIDEAMPVIVSITNFNGDFLGFGETFLDGVIVADFGCSCGKIGSSVEV